MPRTKEIVTWVDQNEQIVKTLTDVQLFYIVQEKFKSILPDAQERDEFLKKCIKDWYYHKISKYHSLSVT